MVADMTRRPGEPFLMRHTYRLTRAAGD